MNMAATWEPQAVCKYQNRHQYKHIELVGASNLKEKTHVRRNHGIVATCLRRHLGLRLLLLWHNGEAKTTPHCVPQVNCGRRISC